MFLSPIAFTFGAMQFVRLLQDYIAASLLTRSISTLPTESANSLNPVEPYLTELRRFRPHIYFWGSILLFLTTLVFSIPFLFDISNLISIHVPLIRMLSCFIQRKPSTLLQRLVEAIPHIIRYQMDFRYDRCVIMNFIFVGHTLVVIDVFPLSFFLMLQISMSNRYW